MWIGYKEFAEGIRKRMEQETGEGGSVSFCCMERNNQTHWEGLGIKGSGEKVQSIFRLEGLYAEYCKGGMEYTVNYIREMLGKKPDPMGWDIPGEWGTVKASIRPALLNAGWNQGLLEGCPYREFLDLAVAYYLKLESGGCCASTIVKQQYLLHWGITEGGLWEAAMENLQGEEYGIKPLVEILEGMLGNSMEGTDGSQPLYVLTNQRVSHGAAGILRKDLLEGFSREVHGDFYILPSSVHETLLLAAEPDIEAKGLREMVQSINREEVGWEEWLSDNVYYYDSETGEIEIAP